MNFTRMAMGLSTISVVTIIVTLSLPKIRKRRHEKMIRRNRKEVFRKWRKYGNEITFHRYNM